ncbi:hypothetical protein AVEN_139499-1 [Araneus ventricosus]|uniref:Uncharacterized protein n=1 Tax=Araneus ventricosus TaxID=182803 RepID=A0A4Y2QKG8_ARAVE|nr:hypothetical protein AVEN_139499-1 [Araneus ventricosus]
MVVHGVAVWTYPLLARQARLLNSIQRKFLLNISGTYYKIPTAALQIITAILPLPLKLKWRLCTLVSRLNISSNLSDTNLSPDHFERKISTINFHPALFSIEDRINLGDHHILKDTINFFTDGSKIQDSNEQDKIGSVYCL